MCSRRALVWLVTDILTVFLFCAVGRRSHDEGLSIAGVTETAWPFLVGTLTGWLVSRGWRRPTAVAPTGIVVWLCTVVIGMVLRKVSSAGVAASFVLVAASVLALLLLGWRAVVAWALRRRVLGLRVGEEMVCEPSSFVHISGSGRSDVD